MNAQKKPVILIGDFNAAFQNEDLWNLGITPKVEEQAGCTPQERASFGKLLADCNVFDTLRASVGVNSLGHFTYWSMRVKNKPLNRGLRLDYCLVSNGWKNKVVEGFSLPNFTQQWGDHCPVGVGLKL